jgi:septal ring factor EnvC (AmiA/AmiB activator)
MTRLTIEYRAVMYPARKTSPANGRIKTARMNVHTVIILQTFFQKPAAADDDQLPKALNREGLRLATKAQNSMTQTKESLESDIAQLEATLASLQAHRKETETKIKYSLCGPGNE